MVNHPNRSKSLTLEQEQAACLASDSYRARAATMLDSALSHFRAIYDSTRGGLASSGGSRWLARVAGHVATLTDLATNTAPKAWDGYLTRDRCEAALTWIEGPAPSTRMDI